jgi:hypothetical protein
VFFSLSLSRAEWEEEGGGGGLDFAITLAPSSSSGVGGGGLVSSSAPGRQDRSTCMPDKAGRPAGRILQVLWQCQDRPSCNRGGGVCWGPR